MIDVSVRRAARSDLDAIARLLGDLGYRPSRDDLASTLATMLARDDAAVWLADDASGSVLGMIALSWRPRLGLGGTIVTVDELVVGEASRDRGVGQALLQLARACARERSARRLELHTARARESYQRRFYVQRGFREVDSAVMRIDAPSEAW